MNIKNLLEYNPSYAKSVGTNEYYFPDTSRHANGSKYIRRQVQHVRNDANNAYEEELYLIMIMQITTKVLPQENYYREHLLK